MVRDLEPSIGCNKKTIKDWKDVQEIQLQFIVNELLICLQCKRAIIWISLLNKHKADSTRTKTNNTLPWDLDFISTDDENISVADPGLSCERLSSVRFQHFFLEPFQFSLVNPEIRYSTCSSSFSDCDVDWLKIWWTFVSAWGFYFYSPVLVSPPWSCLLGGDWIPPGLWHPSQSAGI